jgi:malonyl-CoA O-methyltransferase
MLGAQQALQRMNRMDSTPGQIRTRDLQRRMDRAAETIDEADIVLQTTADGLCDRLLPMQIEPQRILDLGCGTGVRMQQLGRLYSRSRILGVDISRSMLAKARTRRGWFRKSLDVQAHATALPLADDSIDLVFANLLLPFVDDLPRCLNEVARVLSADGLFVFSSLGPDSFAELRDAWNQVDGDGEHVRAFPDMHLIGDAMLHCRLRDPVLDIDFLEVRYQDMRSLYRDLTATGVRNSLASRRHGLTGRQRLRRVEETILGSTAGAGLVLKLELVYGHAWGAAAAPSPSPSEFRFDAGLIGHRGR